MVYFNLNRLKAERVAQGYSQTSFAKAIGMPTTSYWKRENGVVDITVDEFAKMIKVLGYTRNDISLFFTKNVPERRRRTKYQTWAIKKEGDKK